MKRRIIIAIVAGIVSGVGNWIGIQWGKAHPHTYYCQVDFDGAYVAFGWDDANGCVAMWQRSKTSQAWTRLERTPLTAP